MSSETVRPEIRVAGSLAVCAGVLCCVALLGAGMDAAGTDAGIDAGSTDAVWMDAAATDAAGADAVWMDAVGAGSP